jgi:hypothetical protein
MADQNLANEFGSLINGFSTSKWFWRFVVSYLCWLMGFGLGDFNGWGLKEIGFDQILWWTFVFAPPSWDLDFFEQDSKRPHYRSELMFQQVEVPSAKSSFKQQ